MANSRPAVSQALYPTKTADSFRQLTGSPSVAVSPPAFGVVAFAATMPVKAASEAINNTANPNVNFLGKSSRTRPPYAAGGSARPTPRGAHSGNSNAKSSSDFHDGLLTAFKGQQSGRMPAASASTLGRMPAPPAMQPPVTMTATVKAMTRNQSGPPTSPRGAPRGQAKRSAPAGKMPIVQAPVAVTPTAPPPVHIAPAPKTIPTFASKATPATKAAPAPVKTPAKTPAATVIPVAKAGIVYKPTTEARSGRGHF